MEEKDITEQESFIIIQQMINKSKQSIIDRSKYFLMWGIAVFFCAIVQYILVVCHISNTNYIWLSMPLLAIVHIYMSIKDRKKEKVTSYNTTTINDVWIALGISFFILSFISIKNGISVTPFLILFYGIGTFITGRIIQFKPLIYGAITNFILSIVICYVNGAEQLLILALSVLISYIIPAILLKKEFNKQQKL